MAAFNLLKATQVSADIFRAYDIRGIVAKTLTADVVYTIARAIGSQAVALGERQIAIARDGRLSGPELSKALATGLLDAGLTVIDLGAVPTPLLYFAAHTLATQSGVMLTGSHNPPDYNGLKIVLKGETLAAEAIQALYSRIIDQDFVTGKGQWVKEDILPSYIKTITSDIKLSRPLKIVIDCGNGIPGDVAPELYRTLGCEVIELFCEVDGNFPNHHPDPTQLENIQDLIQAVKHHQADLGLAFDGDGDRLGIVTDAGELIWPDRQMMVFAKDIIARNPNATIIFDVKCSNHLRTLIKQLGGQPLMWKTGHSFIKGKMRETEALLAGEMSGHIFFKERWYGFDDGLYAGARLLEILARDTRSCSSVFKELPDSINTPELKIAIAEEQKFLFIERFVQQAQFTEAKLTTLDGLRADFAYGWGLLRASNTTPYLIMRFEADNLDALGRIQEQFRSQLLAIDPRLTLPY
ncbi:MAG: phosphomannomutase/phosphoglucomutase [Gammaproteobacteria bacterium]|jgi:phosphomannomutase/phosphoglucomutase|nr:phosphomannomutase/phosphoglucomutase [Gammaproteobacteria bacterium]